MCDDGRRNQSWDVFIGNGPAPGLQKGALTFLAPLATLEIQIPSIHPNVRLRKIE
jgi:hypothetical protein